MAERDDGVNENLEWATTEALLEELLKRMDSVVFAGNIRTRDKGSQQWLRVSGDPFNCLGMAAYLQEEAHDFVDSTRPIHNVDDDDEDGDDWKRG